MRVLFVQDNGLNESLLVSELSAYLRAAGHHTRLVLEREEADLRAAVERANPDLLFFPTHIRGHHCALGLARSIRGWFPELPQVFAGSHPTFYPDLLDQDGVEMILLGEVEQATVELLDGLAGRRPLQTIPNLHLRRKKTTHRNEMRPLIEDLDSLPLPHRDLYFDSYPFLGAFPWKKFSSGRGCLHSCSYCYQPHYRGLCRGKGQYLRRKSPARVAAEVQAVRRAYPLSNAHFSDDLFITSLAWLRELATVYPSAPAVPFSINSSADFINEEAARLLARSGCRAVAIGVETAGEEKRRAILQKDLDNRTIRRAARLIRDNGMTLVTFNMLASPGESLDEGLATLRFNAEIGCQHARVGIYFPIPGTPMAKQALKDGLCLDGFGRDINARPDPQEVAPQVYLKSALLQEDALINLIQLFSLGISFPWLLPIIERLVRLPRNPLFALGSLHAMLREKALFRFSLLDGLRYFRHVGPPGERTANFVSLV